jgi:peptidoglycan/xylan/chitin deacetylase (PgdA/CDA1 family)
MSRRAAAGLGGAAAAAWCLPALAPRVGLATQLMRVPRRLAAHDAVALTFDDGPHREGTPAVLGALADAGASATFFLVGEQVERDPGLVREVVAAGHGVAVHAHRHRLPLRLGPREFEADLERARTTIAGAAGVEPRAYRPPYGKFSWPALGAVRRSGLAPILWSRDARDWSRGARPESIADALTHDLRGGDVLLLHDSDAYGADGSHLRTATALPRVLEAIGRRGLRTVAL